MTWANRTFAANLYWSTVRVVVESRSTASLCNPEVATAFVVEAPQGGGDEFYLVTARHVVEHAEDATLVFFAKNGDGTELYHYRQRERFNEIWFYHSDPAIDLAITPLLRGSSIEKDSRERRVELVVSPVWDNAYRRIMSQSDGNFIRRFEEIVFVGYPEGFWDRVNGFPILRRGVTASPLDVEYEGKPVFLIDAAVYPGSSGSPVLILERRIAGLEAQTYGLEANNLREEERIAFLGMVTESFHRPTVATDHRNLGVVLKARVIWSLIEMYQTITGTNRGLTPH